MWHSYPPPSLYNLRNSHVRFPVKSTQATVHCSHGFARISVTQGFHNTNSHPIECAYDLSLPSDAVIYGISAKIGENEVKFGLKEKENAKEEYGDAVAGGYTAVMAQVEEAGKVRLVLGCVQPDARVEVRVKMTCALVYRLDHWRCILPKAFFPRHSKGQVSALTLDLTISEDSPILSVASPSHTLQCRIEGSTAQVHLANNTSDLDLIVDYKTEDTSPCIISLEHHPKLKETTAILGYRMPPSLTPSQITGEFIFFLDRSGSMEGVKLKMLKESMIFLLKSLPIDCKFNIISFGSTYKKMYPASVAYNDGSVARAIDEINGFKANLGSTELLAGLKSVLKEEIEEEYPRNIVLLTDGIVEKQGKVYDLVKENKEKTRFHAIGLGRDVSEKWLQGIGLVTNGGWEVVKQPSTLSAALVTFLSRILTPSLTGIEVTWPAECIQAPLVVRNVYEGDSVFVYANFGERVPTGSVTFRYLNTGNKRKEEISIPIPKVNSGKALSKLWAFYRISDEKTPSEQTTLSLKYKVPCAHTTFIGIGTESHMSELPMVTVPQFQPQPRYRHKQAMCRGGGRGMTKCKKASNTSPSERMMDRNRSRSRSLPRDAAAHDSSSSDAEQASSDHEAPLPHSTLPLDSLLGLIAAQTTTGYWSFQSVKSILKSTEIPSELNRLGTQAGDIWATLQVLYLLATKYAGDSQKTVLLVKKAERWLESLQIQSREYKNILQALGY